MPVINGVYTKDFPALGRAPIDTDIIPIAEVANQITYKTTIGAIFNAKVLEQLADYQSLPVLIH